VGNNLSLWKLSGPVVLAEAQVPVLLQGEIYGGLPGAACLLENPTSLHALEHLTYIRLFCYGNRTVVLANWSDSSRIYTVVQSVGPPLVIAFHSKGIPVLVGARGSPDSVLPSHISLRGTLQSSHHQSLALCRYQSLVTARPKSRGPVLGLHSDTSFLQDAAFGALDSQIRHMHAGYPTPS
jgi:hypothetical protein